MPELLCRLTIKNNKNCFDIGLRYNGFTDEPDYIYLLDRFTGQTMDKIKVNTAADQFEVVDDTLFVATYNTAYEFKIESE